MMYNITANWEESFHLYAIENACMFDHSSRPNTATVMAILRMKRNEMARHEMMLQHGLNMTIYKEPVTGTMAAPGQMAY